MLERVENMLYYDCYLSVESWYHLCEGLNNKVQDLIKIQAQDVISQKTQVTWRSWYRDQSGILTYEESDMRYLPMRMEISGMTSEMEWPIYESDRCAMMHLSGNTESDDALVWMWDTEQVCGIRFQQRSMSQRRNGSCKITNENRTKYGHSWAKLKTLKVEQ